MTTETYRPTDSKLTAQRILVPKILDDFFLDAYRDSISRFNGRARESLGKFNGEDGDLKGCSPIMAVHLADCGLLLNDTRIINRCELETLLYFNSQFLFGRYTDLGLALMSAGDSYKPHDVLAKMLATQLKKRGVKLGKGKLIPFVSLKLRENDNSDYGLVFELKENGEDFIEDLEQYKWDFQRKEGISSASYVGRIGGHWNAGNARIAASDRDGRVVIASRSYNPHIIRKPERNKMIYLLNEGKLNDAVNIAQQELRTGPDYLTFYCLATAIWRRARAKADSVLNVPDTLLERAIYYYKQSLFSNPVFAHSYFLIGALYRHKVERALIDTRNKGDTFEWRSNLRNFLDIAKQHLDKAVHLQPGYRDKVTEELGAIYSLITRLS